MPPETFSASADVLLHVPPPTLQHHQVMMTLTTPHSDYIQTYIVNPSHLSFSYNVSSSSGSSIGRISQRKLLNKKAYNKNGGGGGGGGGKKQQRRGNKALSLSGSPSDSGGLFISVEIHGIVLGKRGESCIRGGGPLGERAIAR